MTTPHVTLLRQAVLFSLTRNGWSNYKKIDRENVSASNAEAKRVNSTKKLIDECKELDALNQHMNDIYNWCLARAMPSTAMRRGIYLVKRDQISAFEEKLEEAQRLLHEKYVPEFLAVYQAAKDRAKLPAVVKDQSNVDPEDREIGGLGDLYEESDYPTEDELRGAFGLKWSWLGLSVPDELPEEIRARETAKLKQSFVDAQDEIKLALRAGFRDLIAHAIERLTPDAGGKRKIFQATTITNLRDFFETFNARNMLDDTELEAVVEQAKAIVTGAAPLDDKTKELNLTPLRQDAAIRETTAAQFSEVNALLDTLVTTASRKFNFAE